MLTSSIIARGSAHFAVRVDARHNLFGAGHAEAPAPIGGGKGLLPPHVLLPLGPDRALTFSNVAGTITLNTGIPGLSNDADGNGSYRGLYYLSYGGIAGLTNLNQFGFLAGVFLGDQEPTAPAPPMLDFTDGTGIGRSFISLAPALQQTFFIGDGLTGTNAGIKQQFLVPDGATRLFLGILDTLAPGEKPGFYGDNAGAFLALFEVTGSPAGPVIKDFFSIEPWQSGLRLRYELADTNGVFFIVQSPQIETLFAGDVLFASTNSALARIGVLELPHSTNRTMFFGLIRAAGAETSKGFAWISPGTFTMGSPVTEIGHSASEAQHTVTLSHGFFLSKYELTQREYLAVMSENPSTFIGDLNRPVENVSWSDATNYCETLTASEQAAGRLPRGWAYRLPTEAEWEYACRAGSTAPFHYGPDLLSGMANFDGLAEYHGAVGTVQTSDGIYLGNTTAVGSYQPNGWGLYDMHGNVWELCSDWFGEYPEGAITDPKGPPSGPWRIIRGGGWSRWGADCRTAQRSLPAPSFPDYAVGFRPVLGFSE
jgi:sulfatase modifying factor 1